MASSSTDNPASSPYLADWYGQPASLIASAAALAQQWPQIQAAAEWLRPCSPLLLTGMGSSHHAMLALEAFLATHGIIAKSVDASELLYNHPLPPGAGVIVASRSGESVEIVKLGARCRDSGVPLVAVTNAPESALTRYARSTIALHTDFDHLISLRTYTAVVQGLLALGAALCDADAACPAELFTEVWNAAAERMGAWRAALANTDFFGPGCTYYCLGRAGSWASANEARLKLEEAGKTGATAMLTGAFRHGPQEILSPQFRGVLWLPIDPQLRAYDRALAEDIQASGARCLLIGQDLPPDDFAGLSIELPPIPAPFQPIIDVIPLQIGAYIHARAAGKNPDAFAYGSYVVTSEGGL